MAEVKNAFIKSKMNKDLDSRLLPSGEYRDGQNIQVSKSEGEDVGALENALGNTVATLSTGAEVDFSVLADLPTGTLKSIGAYSDERTSSLFVFLTSNTASSYNAASSNYIFTYNSTSKTYSILVQGNFLNFSTKNEIYGISLLEDLLFWTDNRNQPRKINVTTATTDSNYYNCEDLISVAKYNPYTTIDLYYIDNNVPYSSMQDVVSPYLPNGGQATIDGAVSGTQILIDSLKGATPLIGVSVSGTDVAANTTITGWDEANSTITVTPTQILADNTVLTFSANPFYNKPLGVAINSNGSWPGDPDYLEDKFVAFSYRYRFVDGEYSIMAPFTQETFIPKQDGYFLVGDEEKAYISSVVDFMENKVNNVGLYVPLGTDSLGQDLTPFTLNSKLGVESIEILFKESDSLTVKVLDSVSMSPFDNISNLPENSNKYTYSYQSRKPYKTLPENEIIRVYDKVPVKALGQEVIANRIVYSNFQDKHTPPSHIDYDVVVTEKSTFAQAGISKAIQTTSSVEYPNHNIKQNRSYQVGFVLSDRYGRQSTTILSKVKAFSKTQTDNQGNLITYGGSTYYHPYTSNPGNANNINSWFGDSLKISVNLPAVESNTLNPPNAFTGYNGLYNGDPSSPEYNPLGWYSYKVVVKQNELDYYNVYLPGILNGYPDHDFADAPTANDSIAFITLIGDNVNKVPRDLNEVASADKQFTSSVKLFGRVTPDTTTDSPTKNIPYYPITNPQTVATIAVQDEMFKDDVGGQGGIGPPYGAVYEQDSNPNLARLAQGNNSGNPIGSLQSSNYQNAYNILLGVFETNPRTSLLDIYYETSTSGLVTDLNEAAGQSTTIDGWEGWNFIQSEATIVNGIAVQSFYPTLGFGIDVVPVTNSNVILSSVVRRGTTGPNLVDEWTVSKLQDTPYDTWQLTCNKSQYFQQSTTDNENNFEFVFTAEIFADPNPPTGDPQVAVPPTSSTLKATLLNVAPSFVPTAPLVENQPTTIVLSGTRNVNDAIVTFSAVNGYALAPGSENPGENFNNKSNLTFSINQTLPQPGNGTPAFTLDEQLGVVKMISEAASGSYFFTITVRDSGEEVASQDYRIVFGQEEVNIDFGSTSNQEISQGLESSGVYWGRDYNDSTLIGGNDVPAPVSNIIPGGRSAYGVGDNNLILSDTGLATQTTDRLFANNPDILDGDNPPQPYTWRNVNRKPSAFNGSISTTQNWLQSGTAFIKLDFYIKMWPYTNLGGEEGGPNNQLGVGWPTFLQYRPTSDAAWVAALDVEGQEIKFGGWQQNINQSDSSSPFFNLGFLEDATTGQVMGSGPASANNTDVATSSNFYPVLRQNNAAQPSTASTLSKVFVFGKDQGYGVQNDKFGEYRLITKYPQGAEYDNRFRILPTPIISLPQSNPFDYRGAQFTDQFLKVELSFGDFYYPPNSDVISYPYSVSSRGYADVETASANSSTREVWAREWSMEYVTQFYTNAELTTLVDPWDISSGSFFCYQPTPIDEGNFTAVNGTENSWIGAQGADVTESSIQTPNNQARPLALRKCVAQFNTTGLKVSGSATPVVAGTFIRNTNPT